MAQKVGQNRRDQPERVQRCKGKKTQHKGRQQRWTRPHFIMFGKAPNENGRDQDHRRQHGHPEEFDQRGRVARLFRNREARADDLRHVMDRTAKENTG